MADRKLPTFNELVTWYNGFDEMFKISIYNHMFSKSLSHYCNNKDCDHCLFKWENSACIKLHNWADKEQFLNYIKLKSI